MVTNIVNCVKGYTSSLLTITALLIEGSPHFLRGYFRDSSRAFKRSFAYYLSPYYYYANQRMRALYFDYVVVPRIHRLHQQLAIGASVPFVAGSLDTIVEEDDGCGCDGDEGDCDDGEVREDILCC